MGIGTSDMNCQWLANTIPHQKTGVTQGLGAIEGCCVAKQRESAPNEGLLQAQ